MVHSLSSSWLYCQFSGRGRSRRSLPSLTSAIAVFDPAPPPQKPSPTTEDTSFVGSVRVTPCCVLSVAICPHFKQFRSTCLMIHCLLCTLADNPFRVSRMLLSTRSTCTEL